jgi:hypothetical protein
MRHLRSTSILALIAAVALAACGASKTEIKECALAGSVKCGATCVNLQEDQLNCGACGTACPAGQACSGGACSATCAAPLTKCGSGATAFCASTQTDVANCGSCGNACGVGLACSLGTCAVACAPGLTDCSGSCRDLQADERSCGSCGNVCPAGNVCSAGACALSCQAGLTDCGGSCRDLATDQNNCGGCGTTCGSQVCSAGACSVSCGPGLTTCGAGAASFCADTLADPANCGGCGVACAAADFCVRGACTGPAAGTVRFRGVRTGAIGIATLTGWTQCYLDLYNNPGTTIAGDIFNLCNRTWVLVGCRATGAVNLLAAAIGHTSDVFFVTGNTGSGQNKVHAANGVAWYFDNTWSMGYAQAGDAVSLNSCDTNATGNTAARVCFHTGGAGGYRCGVTTSLNSSTAFERIVFHAD